MVLSKKDGTLRLQRTNQPAGARASGGRQRPCCRVWVDRIDAGCAQIIVQKARLFESSCGMETLRLQQCRRAQQRSASADGVGDHDPAQDRSCGFQAAPSASLRAGTTRAGRHTHGFLAADEPHSRTPARDLGRLRGLGARQWGGQGPGGRGPRGDRTEGGGCREPVEAWFGRRGEVEPNFFAMSCHFGHALESRARQRVHDRST